jgi:hypothetical protein
MDLIPEEMRTTVFTERENILKDLSKPLQCSCFRTSIWDETLYKVKMKTKKTISIENCFRHGHKLFINWYRI